MAWPATTGGAVGSSHARKARRARREVVQPSSSSRGTLARAGDDDARVEKREDSSDLRAREGLARASSTRCLRASASGGNPGRSDVVPLPRAHRFRRGENARSRERPTATCGWEMNPRLESSGRFRRSILESRISTNHARGIISLGVTGNQRAFFTSRDSSFRLDAYVSARARDTGICVRAG